MTTSTARQTIEQQLAHAEAWLAASTENGDPDVHQAQQRVDELSERLATLDDDDRRRRDAAALGYDLDNPTDLGPALPMAPVEVAVRGVRGGIERETVLDEQGTDQ